MMNQHDENILKNFFANASKDQAEKNKTYIDKVKGYNPNDSILGIPMTTIKNFINHSDPLDVSTVFQLVQSEHNEARILGWSLLIRDFSEVPILKYFMLHQAENSGNWNVVDFAAPMASKMLIKRENRTNVEEVGYALLFKETNIWSIRFALMLSIPMVKKDKLNYPMDIVGRSLVYEEPIIQQACGLVLKEVSILNSDVVKYFLEMNRDKISKVTLKELNKK